MKAQADSLSSTREILDSIPLFSNLRDSSLTSLACACRLQRLEKGDILFFQSDASEAAYIVCSGAISIVLNSYDGREMVINDMRPRELFGELGVLTKQPRSTSAIARSNGELLVIPCQAFIRILDDEPQVARRLLDLIAHRLQRSGERESALAFLDAQARLALLLLELDKLEQEKGYITISQEELANRTGLIRQTVAKTLGKWRRAGWLITGRGRIVVLNHKALSELQSKLLM